MHFELIESFTLAGNPKKPNEDAFAHTVAMALVVDGATGLGDENLMPGRSDAQWLAHFSARRLTAHSQGGGDPRGWILAAAQESERSFSALRRREPQENYEVPVASLMLAAIAEPVLQFSWFGDCAALLRDPSGAFHLIGDTLERRASEAVRASGYSPAPAAPGVREEFLPAMRVSRNRVNTESGEWLFAPDGRSAEHAKFAAHATGPGARLMLASDGFLALATDYGRYSPAELLAAAEARGLEDLGRELRAVEAGDPDGRAFPRFKRSDDATALLLSLSA